MPRRRRWPEAAALALALLALGVLTMLNQTRETSPSPDTFSSRSYAADGLRAWYELLQRERADVDRFAYRPAFLNRSVGVLIVVPPRRHTLAQRAFSAANAFTPVDVAALGTWVRAGGRAVVAGAPQLLAALHTGAPLHTVPVDACSAAAFVTLDRLHAGLRRISAGCERFRAGPHCRAAVADAAGTLVLECRYGRGSVYVLSDPQAVSNARIGLADNARLAYALAAPPPGAMVAFEERIHGEAAGEQWWQLLPLPLRWALRLLGLAALAAALEQAWRLGPPRPLRPDEGPTSGAFLDAVAALYARAAARGAVVQAAVEAVRWRLTRRGELGAAARAVLDDLAARPLATDRAFVTAMRELHDVARDTR